MKYLVFLLMTSYLLAQASPKMIARCKVVSLHTPNGTDVSIYEDHTGSSKGIIYFSEAPWRMGVSLYKIEHWNKSFIFAVSEDKSTAIKIPSVSGEKLPIQIGDLFGELQFGKYTTGEASCRLWRNNQVHWGEFLNCPGNQTYQCRKHPKIGETCGCM